MKLSMIDNKHFSLYMLHTRFHPAYKNQILADEND